MVAAIINIVNHHQILEATIAVTTVTIPAVDKTTVNHRIKTVTTRTVTGVEVVQEIIAAVAVTVEVTDMEVVVEEETAVVIIAIILVEAMVEVYDTF